MSSRFVGSSSSAVKTVSIIAIVAIAGLSSAGYFVLQVDSEQEVRSTLFEQYMERQAVYANSVAQNMQSDLELLMSELQTLALSRQVQQGNYSSIDVEALLHQVYEDADRISKVDGVYITDENDVVGNYFSPSKERSRLIGYDGSDLSPVIEYKKNLPNPTFSNAYNTTTGNGTLRIALMYPIYNSYTGDHMGAAGITIVLDSFFSYHGNVNDPNSQYLAALDRNGTVLTSTAKDIVDRNVFSEYVYNTHVDKSAYDHYRRVMDGSPSLSTFSYRTGDRINIGEPINLDGKPAYFLFVVTPAVSIYADMDRVLATHRMENLLLLGGLSAAVSLSVFSLLRWNNTLSKAVQVRTRQLEDANKALQVNEKLQEEFVNVAAHELRTPIQPILGAAELMEGQLDGDKEKIEVTRQEVDLIARNAKRLERLSSDILELSRMDSGAFRVNKETFSLAYIIAGAIKDAKMQSYFNSARVTITYQPDDIFIYADKGKMTQVITNLITNAIKFTDQGTISITTCRNMDDMVAEVSIKDTGTDIDPEIVPRLFEKFAIKSEKGTGIGLYISKRIVEAHGGVISGQNNADGRGAEFRFTVPLAKEEAERIKLSHSVHDSDSSGRQ